MTNYFIEKDKAIEKEITNNYDNLNIVDIFYEQLSRNPDAIAIQDKDQRISYYELNLLSNNVANYLFEVGIKENSIIATYMERSIDLFVTWLGILKVGGAYLPLDPRNPMKRNIYMVNDAGVTTLITKEIYYEELNLLDKSVNIFKMNNLNIDKNENKKLNIIKPTEKRLAYLTYTSGSTGNPKGVQVTNKSVVNLIRNSSFINLTNNDCIGQVSNASFDAVTFEVWGALLNGSRLVIAEDETILSPVLLKNWINSENITTLFITTALLNRVAQECPDTFYGLENLLFGGEACNKRYVEKIFETARPNRLLHMYGPTETTTFALWHEIKEVKEGFTIPIGKPIGDNTQAYVLDEHMQRVPVGVTGELYIGGDGLAIGYLNQPELTSRKFIPNLFSKNPQDRLYMTGDLVKYLPDGNIEYIGRKDNQIKLRGYRIELGEIEEVIRKHNDIKDGVVLVKEDSMGDKKLVGYYTVEREVSKAEIKQFLQERLPKYMVPSFLITMEQFPLTSNGKLDRRSLPEIVTEDLEMEEYVAPRNDIEEMLVEIWSEVLGIERIGVHDNFFELGGHSLLATQVVSRVSKYSGNKLIIKHLFEHPTVEALSKVLGTVNDNIPADIICGSQGNGIHPLSFSQKRLWFLNQLEPENAAYNIPLVYKISGELNYNCLEKSIKTIIRRHKVLRTIFKEIEGEPVQIIREEEKIALPVVEVVDLGIYQNVEAEIDRQLNDDTWKVFELSKGPLFRIKLLKQSESTHILVLNFHHIIFDGWSEKIFINELKELYSAFLKGKDPQLSNLDIQFFDYARWEKESVNKDSLNKQLTYWKEKLSGDLPILELPTDYPRPAKQSYNGDSVTFEISEEITEKLSRIGKEEGATLNMVLLAAFKILLYRYTGHKDLLIGIPVAGRNKLEIEDLIGFFVNTLVIRTDLSGNPSFREFLNQVKNVSLAAYSNQDVSFDKLVEELQPERSISYNPIFQVMFIYHNKESINLNTGDISFEPINISKKNTKFDITLSIEESLGNTTTGEFQFNGDIFNKNKILSMIEHFIKILKSLKLDIPLTDVELLSQKEKKKQIYNWNRDGKSLPVENCINELFEEQVDKTPNNIAIDYEDQRITYDELNRKANKVANFLRRKNISRGDIVGVFLGRSIDAVVSILAILKVGACILPIDTSFPIGRIRGMLSSVEVDLMLSNDEFINDLREFDLLNIVNLNDVNYEKFEDKNIKSNSSTDAAYIVFTSGSTGIPKGIINNHIGIVNYYSFLKDDINLRSDDIILQLASMSVDGFFRDLIGPLTVGAKVVILSNNNVKDHDLVIKAIKQKNVTALLSTVPTFLKSLGRNIEGKCPGVRLILTSGEVLNLSTIESTKEIFVNATLVNLYGPSECTLTTTFKYIDENKFQTKYIVGKPIKNMYIYILDSHKNILPHGVEGELYIGGIGVSTSYINNKELNEECYINNPFVEGEIIYKTGDRGYFLPDGSIVLNGRLDRQVKIRGFRVELDEVERALESHPDINSAIIVVKESKTLDKFITGYLLTEDNSFIDIDEVILFLKRKLPQYMVPAFLKVVEQLPKTSNGKIDRKKVSSWALEKEEDNVHEIINEKEKIIQSTWREILEVENIGLDSNFFRAGGHSLLATQVVSRLRKIFNLSIPLIYIFNYPTIRLLAKELDKLSINNTNTKIVKINRDNFRI